ncbi:MAG: hypothetical protein QW270_00120 [Candidatus Bathyarchaeia archaeon]
MNKKVWLLMALAIAFLSVSAVPAYTLTNPWPNVEIKVTKEEALAIAQPIVEKFAEKYGLTIESVEVEKAIFVVEPNVEEYPVWDVEYRFVERDMWLGYYVAVHVETGEVVNAEPYPAYPGYSVEANSKPKVSPLTAALMATSIGVGGVLSGVGIYKYSRKKR